MSDVGKQATGPEGHFQPQLDNDTHQAAQGGCVALPV